MKNRTPIKSKNEEIGKSRANPNKSPIKRLQPDFQPGLYITPKYNEEDILAIKEAFDTYDSNHVGILNPNDLKVALFHQGFHASKETIYNIIAQYDEDCLGGLNFSAFTKIITGEPAQNEPISEVKKVFRRMDKDNKGYLVKGDIVALLKSLGQQWEEQDVEIILQKIDKNEGNRITFEDFCKVIHHPNSIY